MKFGQICRLIAVVLCVIISSTTFCGCGAMRLSTVANFNIDYANNTLTWDSVDGAKKYEVYLSYPPSGHMWDLPKRELVGTVDSTTFDITDYSDNVFRVKAVAVWNNSLESKEVHVNRNRVLDTVSANISDSGIVQWDEVANALGYNVNIQMLPEPEIIHEFSTTNTTFNLEDYIDTADNAISWGVQISAIGDKSEVGDKGLIYNDSIYSQLQKFPINGRVPLQMPTLSLRTGEGSYCGLIFKVGSHIGSGHYQIFMDDEPIAITTNGIFSFFGFSFETGERVFRVRAIAETSVNNAIFEDSHFSNPVVLNVTHLTTPQNLRLVTRVHNSTGKDFQAIEWDKDNNAMTYDIYVNGVARLSLAYNSAWPAPNYIDYAALQWALDKQEGNTLVVGKTPMLIQVQAIGFGKFANSHLSQTMSM